MRAASDRPYRPSCEPQHDPVATHASSRRRECIQRLRMICPLRFLRLAFSTDRNIRWILLPWIPPATLPAPPARIPRISATTGQPACTLSHPTTAPSGWFHRWQISGSTTHAKTLEYRAGSRSITSYPSVEVPK